MTAFQSSLAPWGGFYAAVAGVSATFIGLLFVALALRPRMMSTQGPTGLRLWAGQTFHSFFVVLIVALFALVPSDSAQTLVVALLIVGAQGIHRVLTDAWSSRADPNPQWSSARSMLRFGTPLAAYAVALWVAQALWRGDVGALDWLVAVVFGLLFSAGSNCWDLLREAGAEPAA